jgi:hypothetical protein
MSVSWSRNLLPFTETTRALPYSLGSASNVWLTTECRWQHPVYLPASPKNSLIPWPISRCPPFQHPVAQNTSFALKRPLVHIPVTWMRLLMYSLQASTKALQCVRYLRSKETFHRVSTYRAKTICLSTSICLIYAWPKQSYTPLDRFIIKRIGELHTTREVLQRKLKWLYVEINQVALSLNSR